MSRDRTVAAFLLAPLATPIAIAIVFLLAWVLDLGWFRGKSLSLVADNIYMFAVLSLVLAYPDISRLARRSVVAVAGDCRRSCTEARFLVYPIS